MAFSAHCYACSIELLLTLVPSIIGAAFALMVLIAAFGFARMAWRVLRQNEEMVSGGSLGNQVFRRTKPRSRRWPWRKQPQ